MSEFGCLPNWDDEPINSPFCERRIWNHEWASFLSSFAYTFLGFYGSFSMKDKSASTKRIFSLLTFLGIGSAFYHYVNYRLYARLDVYPIILILSELLHYSLDSTVYLLVSHKIYCILGTIISILTTSISILFLAATNVEWLSINDNEMIFILASILSFSIIFLMGVFFFKERIMYTTIYYLLTSGCLIGISSVFWYMVERNCTEDSRYFFAHALWHLGTAEALYLITLCIYVIRHQDAYWMPNTRWYHYILPVPNIK